jgi:hypothetical protein
VAFETGVEEPRWVLEAGAGLAAGLPVRDVLLTFDIALLIRVYASRNMPGNSRSVN